MRLRALIGAVAMLALCGPALAADFTIRLSHGDNEANPTHLTALKFKELAKQYTNGRVDVLIFPSNQLGSEEEVVQAVRTGTVQAQIPAMANVHPFAPSAGVLLLPYLFNTSAEAHKGLDALLPQLNERVTKEGGIRFLGILEKDFRVLTNSKRPVKTLADLQGLKIRVPPNQISIKTFKSWGLDPIPMGWAEVFTALQQGVLDGQENPYTTAQTSKFYEVQKYITEIHYQIWTGPLLIGERFFQRMPPDVREAVAKAGFEAVAYGRQESAKQTEAAKVFLREKGMVLQGAPEDEPKWQEAARTTWPDLYGSVGGEEWAKTAVGVIEQANKK